MKLFNMLLLIAGILILLSIPTFAQKVTISGHIKDKANGEALIGATVFIKGTTTGTISNPYSFYSLSLEKGAYIIVYSFIGYQPKEFKIELTEDKVQNIELSINEEELNEVVVTSKREKHQKVQMGVEKLNNKLVKRIPVLMGEADVMKAMQLMPGVKSISEGSSGLSVRGGNFDQNMILLDEAAIYNASHLMGFISTFNSDVIKTSTLYKGDIPAEYGGRLSSLMDIRMKDGNSKEFCGIASIGTLAGRLTVEGPLKKDKASFIISARRNYFDLFFPLIGGDLQDGKMYFYDLNMKVNYKINDNNRVFLSGYFGRDFLSIPDMVPIEMGWGNYTGTFRWNHLFSNKWFSNISLIISSYDYYMGMDTDVNFKWNSKMEDYSFKYYFSFFPNSQNTLKFGIASTYHQISPGETETSVGSEPYKVDLPVSNSLEHSVFLSNEVKFSDKLHVNLGLRYTLFQNIGEGTVYDYNKLYEVVDKKVYENGHIFNTYNGFEPRISLRYAINLNSSAKVSYSRTTQFLHLASNTSSGSPLDIWFTSSPNIKPQIGDQYALGYFTSLAENGIELSCEGFYKQMQNQIDFVDHADILLNEELEGEIRVGNAESFGVELMVQKNTGKLTGWISYTYSKALRTINGINEGKTYNALYDRPHDITVVANYQLNKRITLAANWTYYTGSLATLPAGKMKFSKSIVPVYAERNSFRMKDYHRLDLSFTLKSKKRPGKKLSSEFNFSVYNAYYRKNTFMLNFEQDSPGSDNTKIENIYLFPIIPSISYTIMF